MGFAILREFDATTLAKDTELLMKFGGHAHTKCRRKDGPLFHNELCTIPLICSLAISLLDLILKVYDANLKYLFVFC